MNLTLRQGWVGLRLLVVMTVLLGIAYPVALFAVGRLVSGTSDGSYVTRRSGAVVGSALIGQSFDGDDWFWPRPSAAGDGYDALSSGGSNLAADNPDLVAAVGERQSAGRSRQRRRAERRARGRGDRERQRTRSRHQPGVRPAAGRPRRGGSRPRPAAVAALVDEQTQGRLLGFIGEPRVNVLRLNLALENLG